LINRFTSSSSSTDFTQNFGQFLNADFELLQKEINADLLLNTLAQNYSKTQNKLIGSKIYDLLPKAEVSNHNIYTLLESLKLLSSKSDFLDGINILVQKIIAAKSPQILHLVKDVFIPNLSNVEFVRTIVIPNIQKITPSTYENWSNISTYFLHPLFKAAIINDQINTEILTPEFTGFLLKYYKKDLEMLFFYKKSLHALGNTDEVSYTQLEIIGNYFKKIMGHQFMEFSQAIDQEMINSKNPVVNNTLKRIHLVNCPKDAQKIIIDQLQIGLEIVCKDSVLEHLLAINAHSNTPMFLNFEGVRDVIHVTSPESGHYVKIPGDGRQVIVTGGVKDFFTGVAASEQVLAFMMNIIVHENFHLFADNLWHNQSNIYLNNNPNSRLTEEQIQRLKKIEEAYCELQKSLEEALKLLPSRSLSNSADTKTSEPDPIKFDALNREMSSVLHSKLGSLMSMREFSPLKGYKDEKIECEIPAYLYGNMAEIRTLLHFGIAQESSDKTLDAITRLNKLLSIPEIHKLYEVLNAEIQAVPESIAIEPGVARACSLLQFIDSKLAGKEYVPGVGFVLDMSKLKLVEPLEQLLEKIEQINQVQQVEHGAPVLPSLDVILVDSSDGLIPLGDALSHWPESVD
jgi:hypothetical protein